MAAIALDELFRSLLSKTGQEKMTSQEANVFVGWKSQTIRSCAALGSVATGLTWVATRKMSSFNRATVAGGAGFFTVMWRLRRSVDSCVDRILGMDGSRMQHELKKIILEKYGNDPEKMRLFSKHFYCEELFSDSTPGHPKSVYRQRHTYVDEHRTADGDTNHESTKKGVINQPRSDDSNVKVKSSSSEIKQVPINPGINIFGYGDPLDVLFGDSSANEELAQPDESGSSAKVQSRSQKRARRRHRIRHRHQESGQLGEI